MGIGNRIKEARENKGLTQEQLAKMIGITKGAIANYENGISHPKEAILYELFKKLSCDANYLFQDELPDSSDSSLQLSSDKTNLLNKYDKLNNVGKNEAQKRVAELTELPRYIEDEKKQPDKEPDYDKIREILMQDPSMADIVTVAAKDGHGVEIRYPKDKNNKEDSNKED